MKPDGHPSLLKVYAERRLSKLEPVPYRNSRQRDRGKVKKCIVARLSLLILVDALEGTPLENTLARSQTEVAGEVLRTSPLAYPNLT